jgi:hypothetical protein
MAKSRKNSSRKSNPTQIVLWILFSLSVVGLIISIVVQCRNNENFKIIDDQLLNGPAEVLTSPQKGAGNNIQRCGAGGCQSNLYKFPDFQQKDYNQIKKESEYYPVKPDAPIQCNPASKAWLHYATPRDICNLTTTLKSSELSAACAADDARGTLDHPEKSEVRKLVNSGKIDSKILRCDRSCPQAISACGLHDASGLARGVM